MIVATTASTRSGASSRICGSSSIPTETKNRTEKASRNGNDSRAARWLSADSRITTPAKNAPIANETPNSSAEPYAMTTAAAITHSVNNSRDPVRATCHSSHGKTRRPTTSISPTNSDTFAIVSASARARSPPDDADSEEPPSQPASAGSSTSASTIARSSTTSQPTAIRPLTESSWPRPSSARISTTVLATESARPNTTPAPRLQPHSEVSPIAS